ncbi:hypothetical protein EMCRGX_G019492 [Ephydatia muelleri]
MEGDDEQPKPKDLNLEPNLNNVLEQDSLKWIFVGGKGGVGKTTCSCSLAVLLSKKFTKTPVKVRGYDNLYAMEIDPAMTDQDEIPNEDLDQDSTGLSGLAKELFTEFADSLPGIDEAKSFFQVMALVQELQFSVVVFDTAPTGHTLRFLSMPGLFEKGLNKISQLKSRFGSLFSQLLPAMGVGEDSASLRSKLTESLPVIQQINSEFRDAEKATFICVCIAEFLSLYETERLVQELTKLGIDVHNIVVNQLVVPERDDSGSIKCKMCASRYKLQSKYLEQIHDLYEDFYITECPLLPEEEL